MSESGQRSAMMLSVEGELLMLVQEKHGGATDPYRILFPLGILMGIVGVSIWPLYYWGIASGYNGRSHAFVQTDCFMYAFIAGFLWTAIPRFTGTSTPARGVQFAVAGMLAFAAVSFELQYFRAGHLIFLAAHVAVISVAVKRFRQRQHPPPETFVLVGIAMLSGLIGAVINAGIVWELVPTAWDLMGKRLLSEGMILLLVLGVGGVLGPRLLGFAQLPNFQNLEKISGSTKTPAVVRHRQSIYAIAGFALLLTVIAEYGWNVPALAWLRAWIASALVLVNIRPWLAPIVRTTLAWCVWTAHWLLIIALWLAAVLPKYRIDVLHVLFIGAFTLLILAVATRVVLSHGGHALAEEKKSWPLRIGLITGLIAMLARVAAPFAPAVYFSHLAWAAVLWIGGISFWGIYLLRRIRSSH